MPMAIARCESFGTFRDAWSSLEADYGDRTWLVVVDRNLLRANEGALRGLGEWGCCNIGLLENFTGEQTFQLSIASGAGHNRAELAGE